MNRLWAAGVIAIMVFFLCFFGIRATDMHTQDVCHSLVELKEMVRSNETEKAYDLSKKVLEEWRVDCYQKLSTFISHSRLEGIDQSLSALPALISYQTNDQFEAECDKVIEQVTRLKDSELPTLQNIL